MPASAVSPDGARNGRFRRALRRLTADEHELEAEGLQQEVAECGATAITRCRLQQDVRVAGALSAVTLRSRAGLPALEAELYDGSGLLTLVWLGRRRIAGIEPGRQLVVHGRLTVDDAGRPVLYNPEYELRPVGSGR